MKFDEEDAIFQLACALGEDERKDFLESEGGGTAEIRDRVKQHLEEEAEDLEGEESATELEHQPPASHSGTSGESSGSQIGPYRLLEKLGEGGMGTVWRAGQESPVKRTVALKIIKAGMDSAEVIARFEAERQTLAMMDHPNIARVYDAGATTTGRLYFVMEMVNGTPITRYCDNHRLSPRDRLALFIEVCKGLQHAHQKGVIHRDLKPTNILVSEHDGKPLPKLIDFGIAKATNEDLAEQPLFTKLGQMMGTPAYMSPEQAAGKAHEVDTRTDIYALGVLLYELLTGTTPLNASKLKAAGYAEAQRLVAESDPPRPSTHFNKTAEEINQVARLRRVEPANRLGKLIRGDLDWIVMKALEKEPDRRYPTARSFAADIERYLHSEPVEARPPSTVYRLRKFFRRHRAMVGAATAVTAVVVLAVVTSLLGRAEQTRKQAQAHFEALFDTRSDRLETVVTRVRDHHRYLGDRLAAAATDPHRAPRDHARARLALLPRDPGTVSEITAWLLTSDPDELTAFLRLLGEHRDHLRGEALAVLSSEEAHPNQRLRAAAICAEVAPDHPALHRQGDNIAGWLVNRSALDAARWMPLLQPMSSLLIEPLHDLAATERDGPIGEVAALALSAFHRDDPKALIDLTCKASARQHWHLCKALSRLSERAKSALTTELATDRTASERTNLAMALLQISDGEPVWPLFRRDPQPDLRTTLLHRLAPYQIDWRSLTERLSLEQDPGVLSALLLALGEYNLAQFPGPNRTALRQGLLEDLYAHHPDSGVRSASRWLLARWLTTEWEADPGATAKLGDNLAPSLQAYFAALDQANSTGASIDDRNWYVTRNGDFTMAIVPGPVQFEMGSPPDEADRRPDEELHEEVLEHSFAIATTEVPRKLFDQFLRAIAEEDDELSAKRDRYGGPHAAITFVDLREAMFFCRWYSKREGIEESEQCYDLDPESRHITVRDGWLRLGGYRLPTEAEWEYACRAGTRTARFSGSDPNLLASYAWYSSTAESERVSRIPGLLRPNPLGIFDILGNVSEWCQEPYSESYRSPRRGAFFEVRPNLQAVYRGGSFYHPFSNVRSAWRGPTTFSRYLYQSFRLARTVKAK